MEPFTTNHTLHQNCYASLLSESDQSKFWELETVGIKPKELVESHNDPQRLREFESTVQFVNGRYEVALPWKDDFAKERLMHNEIIARKKVE